MNLLTFQISVKTEIDEQTWFKVLKELFPNSDISVKESKFDWDAQVEIATPSQDEYYQLADELYSKVMHNPNRFNDWEYKFISDMYSYSLEKKQYSEKQRSSIRKMRDKFL